MGQRINFENLKELSFQVNESYKRIRTNISFSGDDIKTIAITSTVPNEGKTEVSFNICRSVLAVITAFTGSEDSCSTRDTISFSWLLKILALGLETIASWKDGTSSDFDPNKRSTI